MLRWIYRQHYSSLSIWPTNIFPFFAHSPAKIEEKLMGKILFSDTSQFATNRSMSIDIKSFEILEYFCSNRAFSNNLLTDVSIYSRCQAESRVLQQCAAALHRSLPQARGPKSCRLVPLSTYVNLFRLFSAKNNQENKVIYLTY